MDVSIIIVNWNSKEYLGKCLASIHALTNDIKFEIVVIDNASFDGVEEMLKQYFPQVRFIQSEKNLGFARANNAAFQSAHGRHILFLNPDTEIEGEAVQTLSHWLDSATDIGIAGPKLLNGDRSIQTTSIRAFPTILNQIVDLHALRRVFPRAGLWGAGPLFRGGVDPVAVDAVSGACLMIKRPVFEAVGLFSGDYFMYSEDIDLCFKANEAGWKTIYVPAASVVHHGGTSSSQSKVSTFSSVMMLESRWRFFRKTRSSFYCWSYRFAMALSSVIRIALAVVAWPIYRVRGRGDSIQNVIRKWSARLRWTFGGESWVKSQ
ncbi:MAG: glycosyltransferase family 2 protein [Nitrospirota bacterium]